MRHVHPFVAAVAALALMAPAHAVELGDAKAGEEYAASVCAECHEIGDADTFSPNPDAPTFKAVANTPGMTARALAVWLQSSHPTMPNFILAPAEMDNVIAYILSLRTKS